MDPKRTQFDYLLNAVLHAAQADKPADHGYRDKTLALFAYVRQLEAVAAKAAKEAPSEASRGEGIVMRQFMPIQRHPEFRLPWSLIEPHAEQAMKNHGQTLERLAERGGLGFSEALAIMCDLDHRYIGKDGCRQSLETLIAKRTPATPGTPGGERP